MSRLANNVSNGQITWCCHRTYNGENPSSSFRGMHSVSLDPAGTGFDMFVTYGHVNMGQLDKCPWRCPTTSKDNSIELRTEENHPIVSDLCNQTDMGQMGNNGQSHIGQVGKWSWCCTITNRTNATKCRIKSDQQFQRIVFWSVGKPKWVKWASDYNVAQLQILDNSKEF